MEGKMAALKNRIPVWKHSHWGGGQK